MRARTTKVRMMQSSSNRFARRQNRRQSDNEDNGSGVGDAIPEMELLQINYVNKNLPQRQQSEEAKIRSIIAFKKQVSAGQAEQTQKITTKSLTRNQNGVSFQHSKKHSLKYAVYKKHNSNVEKLQYINDNSRPAAFSPQSTLTKTKNIIFGPSSSKIKFDNIQFYFDSKGYAQHVDKIYGTNMAAEPVEEISKSNSWSFRKMPPPRSPPPPPPPPPMRRNLPRDTKIVPLKEKFHFKAPVPVAVQADAVRIRKLFESSATEKIDETAGSLKKVKKLVDNFDNRCTCSNASDAVVVQKSINNQAIKSKRKNPSNDRMNNSKRDQRIAMNTENVSQIFTAPADKVHVKPTSGGKTCGWQKCTFDNCPMSSSSSSTSDDCNKDGNYSSSKCIDDYLPTIKELNGYAIDDDESNETRNNLRNLKEDTTLPVDAITPKFTKNAQNLNDSMKCKQITKVDFKAKSVAISGSKQMNTLVALMAADVTKIDDDRKQTNCVKIFISNSETPSIKSTTSSDSSDLGYYEKITSDSSSSSCLSRHYDASAVAAADRSPSSSSSSGVVMRRNPQEKLSGLFPSRMGCDGAIFWNDCYYYDEHACCRCSGQMTSEKKSGKFICVCDVDQVRFKFMQKQNKRLVQETNFFLIIIFFYIS